MANGIWPQPQAVAQLTFKGVSRYLPCTLIIYFMRKNIINCKRNGCNGLRAFFGQLKKFSLRHFKNCFWAIGNWQLATGNWRLSTATLTLTST